MEWLDCEYGENLDQAIKSKVDFDCCINLLKFLSVHNLMRIIFPYTAQKVQLHIIIYCGIIIIISII